MPRIDPLINLFAAIRNSFLFLNTIKILPVCCPSSNIHLFFRSRSALREVAKAYSLPPDEVSTLADSLPYRWYGPPSRRGSKEDPFAELAERYHTPTHLKIFKDAAALIGVPHHLSVHPGGVVISPGPLTDIVFNFPK
jgi:DNA polymerase-3 subunit alpha/error-prone DNA polymerase